MGNGINDLKKYCTGANILEGLPVQGSYAKDSKVVVIDWLNKKSDNYNKLIRIVRLDYLK